MVEKCFIIMPISTPESLIEAYNDPDHFTHVLQYLFRPALETIGYEVIPPTATGADIIHANIIKNLEEADLVLCDISTLNPNVFFELGIRTSLDRPAALVRDNFTLQIPFDTSSINTHTYDASLAPWSIESEVPRLANYITEVTTRADGRNSMWCIFGITQRAMPAEINNLTDAKLDLLMTQVGQLVKKIEGGQSPTYDAEILGSYSNVDKDTGRRYRWVDLTVPGNNRPALVYEWHGVRPAEGQSWRYSMETLERMYADGRIEFRQTGRPVAKYYLDEQPKGSLRDARERPSAR
jgi:hypothetical protein